MNDLISRKVVLKDLRFHRNEQLQTPTETASVLRGFKMAFIDNGKPKLLKKIKKGKGEA